MARVLVDLHAVTSGENATDRSRNCGWSKPRNLELVSTRHFQGEPAIAYCAVSAASRRAPQHIFGTDTWA